MTEQGAQRGSSNIRGAAPTTMADAAGLAVTARGGQAAVGVPVKREPPNRLAAFRDQPLAQEPGPAAPDQGPAASTIGSLPSDSGIPRLQSWEEVNAVEPRHREWFCGYDLLLEIDRVYAEVDHLPTAFAGHDDSGEWFVMAAEDSTPERTSWICSPTSERCLECLDKGLVEASELVRHSTTGVVELVRCDHGQVLPEMAVTCSDLDRVLA